MNSVRINASTTHWSTFLTASDNINHTYEYGQGFYDGNGKKTNDVKN